MLNIVWFLIASSLGSFNELYSRDVEASSFLKSTWNKYEENYHPNYVLDGNPKTAWVEGVEGNGEGESITIPLSKLTSARTIRLVIWNGYQKSKSLLNANSAPNLVTVLVIDPEGRMTGKRSTKLQRIMGPQKVEVPVDGSVAEVKLVIDSVHPGTKYKDTCISDIQVHVDSEVPYNQLAEKAKRAELNAWLKQRKDTAAFFAKLPAEYPFVSARFESTKREPEELSRLEYKKTKARNLDPSFETVSGQLRAGLGGLSKEERALLERLIPFDGAKESSMPQRGSWQVASFKKQATLRPDNLDWLFEPSWLTLSDVAFFEAKGREGRVQTMSEWDSVALSNYFVMNREDGSVSSFYFTQTRTYVDRSTTTTVSRRLAVFDELQRLVAVAEIAMSNELEWGFVLGERFQIQRYIWDAGKISKVSIIWTDYVASMDNEVPFETAVILRSQEYVAGPSI